MRRASRIVIAALSCLSLSAEAQEPDAEEARTAEAAPLQAPTKDPDVAELGTSAKPEPVGPEASAEVTQTESGPAPFADGSDAPREAPTAAVPEEDLFVGEELTAAELASLGIDVENAALDTDLHLSGFMDTTYAHLLNPHDAALSVPVEGTRGSFFVGRLNLYLNKNVTEHFSTMMELRFTYAPNGTSPLAVDHSPVDTETLDYSSTTLTFRWGGVVIERAYGTWSPLPYFNLRLGQFLSPYGIWNIDHGTPVFIAVRRPYAVSGNFFPERQTGLEAFGRAFIGSSMTVRYHLTLSNGLGPVSEYRDLDSNKAIGGRLALERMGREGRLQLGGSAFYGHSSAGFPQLGVSKDGSKLDYTQRTDGNARVLSVAADFMWLYKALHVQGEWVGQRREFAENGRTVISTAGQLGVPVNALSADSFSWGAYGLVGYRLPWWGIMPFTTVEYARSTNIGTRSRLLYSQTGINVRPVDAIVFKAQYQYTLSSSPGTRLKSIAAQLAWAF